MSTTQEQAAGGVIEPEPTVHGDPARAGDGKAAVATPRPGLTVALEQGSLASLTAETDTLRRRRLLAAAVSLAVAFGLLCAWVFASANPGTLTVEGSRYSLRAGLVALRCVLALVVAGLLASAIPFSRGQLRVLESVLFLGLALLLMVSQYFVGLDLMCRGSEFAPVILAFAKDGVIQMMALMMLYGTLIPNRPATAAWTIAPMFVGLIAVERLLRLHPDVAPVVEQLRAAEESGSNALFLAIGAALAVYGSFLVNGLRVELHEARKFGQYRLIRKLGEGGMGVVFLAEHALLKRPCALKQIKASANSEPLALARFEREVQSAARLSHPNTIEIFDYGHTVDGTFYYVMEYLRGMSLADLLHECGPLPPGRVVYLFRQVCKGLAEAHDLGMVHRDLKPANVFLAVRGGESDVAKVLDFGLVKLTRDPGAATLTTDVVVSGTPLFMAPEQAKGERTLDARADLYALGAVMYCALTGRPPFEGDSAFDVMMAHARDPVTPPGEVRPDVPADLEEVVLRCLAKRPDDRYPNSQALGEALAACACAGEWGPHRAEAWWEVRLGPGTSAPDATG
jgi:tRNA A-37 threonylcarbamoyl transferase component Bud32